MAKVTSYPEILSSNLDPSDLFYIVDHNPVDGKNVSRNIRYETLYRDLGTRISVDIKQGSGIGINEGTISVRIGENLGFDTEGKLTANGSGGGVSYDYVKQNLSSDGYGLKAIFREWSYVE